MSLTNLIAGWMGLLLSIIAGMISGLFFDKETWMGGYNSWARRMVRLGHISFFGIGMLNLVYYLSGNAVDVQSFMASGLFVGALITMPLVCYLSAWKKYFRHLFFIPVLCALLGTADFVWRLVKL